MKWTRHIPTRKIHLNFAVALLPLHLYMVFKCMVSCKTSFESLSIQSKRSDWNQYRHPNWVYMKDNFPIECSQLVLLHMLIFTRVQLAGSWACCQGNWCRRRLPSPTTLGRASFTGVSPPKSTACVFGKMIKQQKTSHFLGARISDSHFRHRQFLINFAPVKLSASWTLRTFEDLVPLVDSWRGL